MEWAVSCYPQKLPKWSEQGTNKITQGPTAVKAKNSPQLYFPSQISSHAVRYSSVEKPNHKHHMICKYPKEQFKNTLNSSTVEPSPLLNSLVEKLEFKIVVLGPFCKLKIPANQHLPPKFEFLSLGQWSSPSWSLSVCPPPQSSCSSPSVSRMGVSSHPPTRDGLFNPQITHVSHFSKSLKVNRAHKNKPAPAIHPLNLAKPCDVLRTHVSAAGQTSGGKELEQTNGDIERIYSASQTH